MYSVNRSIKITAIKDSPENFVIDAKLSDNFHEMTVRLVVKEQDFMIKAISVNMIRFSNSNCIKALDDINFIVGLCLGKGFTKKVLARLSGNKGCTHLTNLILQINAGSMLLAPVWDEELRAQSFLDACIGWSSNNIPDKPPC